MNQTEKYMEVVMFTYLPDKFTARFDNGVICEWYAASYKAANRMFKMFASFEGHGILYINDTAIRESGQRIEK